MPYVGRFAPSPTGLLHFGSLLTAVASYLDARHSGGLWLVRIEDLDPPREMAGAASAILATLEKYGLEWDNEVWYQSKRHDIYQDYINGFLARHQAYYCTCTRKHLQRVYQGIYPGTCRNRYTTPPPTFSVRIRTHNEAISFEDAIQGEFSQKIESESGDFIIKRKDGLFAYHLAVVIDDQQQGITEIVRGVDLIDSTPKHIHLQRLLGFHTPRYAHLPVITNELGQKLSKQTFAKPVPDHNPSPYLWASLAALQQDPPTELRKAPPRQQLEWAIANWNRQRIPRTSFISENSLPIAL